MSRHPKQGRHFHGKREIHGRSTRKVAPELRVEGTVKMATEIVSDGSLVEFCSATGGVPDPFRCDEQRHLAGVSQSYEGICQGKCAFRERIHKERSS